MDRTNTTNTWPGSAGEHELQERYDTAERAHRFYSQQVLNHLNEQMREFVAEQEMMFVATSDAHGECDNTFRAGPPGFVRVLDEERLAWPEYRGNGVMASLGNMTENPHVGLLFVDFVRSVIGLHVNGRAAIVEDAAMRTEYDSLDLDDVPGRRPERWVVVEVEEAYIHCAKHIPRLAKVPRERAWGTDDVRRKGGDFFAASKESRPWAAEGSDRKVPTQRPQASDMAGAARVAETADARADEGTDVPAVAESAPAVVGSDVPAVVVESAAVVADFDAPAVAGSAKEGRPSPGRHRRPPRPLRLLGHTSRSAEDYR